jgi:hypothetical protein
MDTNRKSKYPKRIYAIYAVLSALFVAIPFLCVEILPSTDLPQHTAQIRMFQETFSDNSTQYTIQWFTPNSLVYLLLGVVSSLFRFSVAGKITLYILAAGWVFAIHGVAFARDRPPLAAAIASVFVFNLSLYWGSLQFLMGFPVFCVWLLLIGWEEREVPSLRKCFPILFISILLYLTHAHWLLMALACTVLLGAWRSKPIVWFGRVGLFILPALIALLSWYFQLANSGFDSATKYLFPPTSRFTVYWLVNSMFGGLKGPVEYLTMGVVSFWIGLSLWQNRSHLSSCIDPLLLQISFAIGLASFLLPDHFYNTVNFAERWVAPAVIMLLLALPAPRFREVLLKAVTFSFVLAFCISTAFCWVAFERDELSGLAEALQSLPYGKRVLGLSFQKESAYIKRKPFIQMFAYSQVLKGGSLNFSFSDLESNFVVRSTPLRSKWISGLEWFPERFTANDLQYFDYAIVSGDENLFEQLASRPDFFPITERGAWRLYSVSGGRDDS